MGIKPEDAVRLVIALIWPLVVVGLAVLFRRELGALIEGALGLLRGSLTKISLPGGFAFELAKTTEFKADWSAPGGQDLRNMVAIGQPVSGVPDILALLAPSAPAQSRDYVVFDLRSGDGWLTSRLHLFSLVLRRMHGLRYCVFVYNGPEGLGRWLGYATTEAVRWSLAMRYPHLEQAADQAMLRIPDARVTSRQGGLDPRTAATFINNYLEAIQINPLLTLIDIGGNVTGLVQSLLDGQGAMGILQSQLTDAAKAELQTRPQYSGQLPATVEALNATLEKTSLYDETSPSAAPYSKATKALASENPQGGNLVLLNRYILQERFPQFFAPVTLPAGFTQFDKGWARLQTRDPFGNARITWEHARFLKRDSVETMLGADLGRAQVSMASLQAAPRKDQVSTILRAEGDMVALVSEGAHFERLVDRRALAAKSVEFTL
ncbi:MAG: hypothetical protein WBE72_09860 [Terracidiphilus sp.]